jgi:tryptophan-rich sensory protein
MERPKTEDIVKFVVSVVVCMAAGYIGSMFTRPAIATWYTFLRKPPFTPPDWVFAPVWTLLYFLMAVALFVVWRRGFYRWDVRLGMLAFLGQLVLNVCWSFVFFGLASPLYGLFTIGALWMAILVTIIFFSKVSRKAGLLLVPYLAWVSYAALLNLFIWIMNK